MLGGIELFDVQLFKLKQALKRNAFIRRVLDIRRDILALRSRSREQKLESLILLRGQDASDAIRDLLDSGRPCLIGRFGSCEIGVVQAYYRAGGGKDVTSNVLIHVLSERGGFYPVSMDSVSRFAELYLNMMPDIDILGSWCVSELTFLKQLQKVKRISLGDIEPYIHEKPWSKVLQGRRVLIINPLVDTIEMQYKKRHLLFSNADVLPEFNLLTYKSVYEFNKCDHAYASWFDALDKMEKDISTMKFDVAVIGCGPFGMPLASFIKKLGRQAVVMGGATQVWFGIHGVRWDGDPFFQKLYNQNWVYPSEKETPKDAKTLEDGCYWKP